MTAPGERTDLVEVVAEALHNVEYPTYSPTAVRDHNRWSWRGAGEDPDDPKPAMGFLGDNGETDHYDHYRDLARAVLAAVLPQLTAERDAALAQVQAVEALCDDYRANCDPKSVQAQVAEMFRAALAAAQPTADVMYSKDVPPGETFVFGDGRLARSIEDRPAAQPTGKTP